MSTDPIFLMDADVFLTAKNRYYAFDICPGFWSSIIHYHQQRRIYSIDRVRNELLVGRKTEDLAQWVTSELPDDFFLNVDDDNVASAYTEIMMWVQRHPRYFDYAKAKFATGADGWLVAYARVHNVIVVTNEEPAPDSKREVKLPDVCDQFKVTRKDTFVMLKELSIRFEWAGAR